MSKYLLLVSAVLVPMLAQAKKDLGFSVPVCIYTNAKSTQITSVQLTDTAAIVSITVRGKINSSFNIKPTVYLSDEQSRIYSVKGAQGIHLGEKLYIPKCGEASFKLLFDPLPKSVKVIDVIEGHAKNMYRWLGVYDKKSRFKLPEMKHEVDGDEVSESAFTKGTATVRGRITDYKPNSGYGNVFFDYQLCDDAFQYNFFEKRKRALIHPDGTFECQLNLRHPILAQVTLKGEMVAIPFYVRPGDMLDIEVSGLQDARMSVRYKSSHPKGCYENLLQHLPPIDFIRQSEVMEASTTDDIFLQKVENSIAVNKQLCNYTAWKYKLSSWESHLLWNRVQSDLIMQLYLWFADGQFGKSYQFPKGKQYLQADFLACNFRLFDMLKAVDGNDASLSFIGNFPGALSVLKSSAPIRFNHDHVIQFMNEKPIAPVEMAKMKDSLDVKIMQHLLHRKDVPWLTQMLLVNSIDNRLLGATENDVKKIKENLSSYITYPYLKELLTDLCEQSNALHQHKANSQMQVYDIPNRVGLSDFKKLLRNYQGKNVHVVWLNNPKVDYRLLYKPGIKSTLSLLQREGGLNVLFVFNKEVYTQEEIDRWCAAGPQFQSNAVTISPAEYYKYVDLLNVDIYKETTINADGKRLLLTYSLLSSPAEFLSEVLQWKEKK